jgi:hypothetical protein
MGEERRAVSNHPPGFRLGIADVASGRHKPAAARRHLLMHFDEGELRGPIDRDEETGLSSAVRTSAMSIRK